MEKLILIGAGGHSKSVADSIDPNLFELVGFIDENKKGTHLGKPILGCKIEDLNNYMQYCFFVAIGDVKHRKNWFERINKMGLSTINIIDKTALISKSTHIGTGNFVGKYAVINADVTIGNNNIINTKALVEHESRIGSNIHLSTNSVINGNVIVEDNVFFGSNAVCNGQLKIGEGSVIGSGAAIIEDVEPYTTVVGVPGRIVKRRIHEN